MSTKNVTLKEKVNGALGDTIFPATTTPNVYDPAKSQSLSQTLVNTPDYEALGFAKFSTATAYNAGDKVYKDNELYRFIADKTAGEWDVAKVEPWSIEQEIESVDDAIRSLIPAQASADNKLADKAYVNDKVSTDTATFRGTFNLVTDLELTTEATQGQIATALGTAISGEDKNDYAFVQIPTSDATPTEIARIDRYKYTGLQWAFEYSLNNSGFTAEQWAAINSGITSSLVTAFGAKYDKPAGGIPKTDLAEGVQTSLNKGDSALQEADADERYLRLGSYSASTAVGLADNLRGDVTSTEQFRVRPTGGAGNEVGQIGALKAVQGAGFASAQLYPEGSDHTFSADADITDAVLRYSDAAETTELGYLMCMECFINKVFDQTALDAVSAKDAGKSAGDKCVWLTPAGGVTSAPTIADGDESVTFSGWRIAMRVKASEVRDHTAVAYWFTDGSVGRQVKDVAVAVGINGYNPYLADGWNTKSAMEFLLMEAQNGLPTVQRKAEQKLLGVTRFGFRTVKSRNLLNPATGKAFVTAYTNDEDGFLDNQCTVIGGLPSGTTLSFQSLLTGETEAITVDSNNRFVVPCSGWVLVSGTLPSAIILTWNGKYDSAPADTYETESHSWVVSGLKGKLNGEGEMVQCFSDGVMKSNGGFADIVKFVNSEANVIFGDVNLGNLDWTTYNALKCSYKARLSDRNQSAWYKVLVPGFAPCVGDSRNPAGQGNKTVSVNGWSIAETGIHMNDLAYDTADSFKASLSGVHAWYPLNSAYQKHFTSLTYTDPQTGVETALSELQFADNNWSFEETIYDEPTTDANGVQTPVAVTPVLTSEYSMDAAEQLDTLKQEYAAIEERVAAIEQIINP